MQSLFPTTAARGRGGRAEAPLVTFKAGKCELESLPSGKFKVSADVRKGQISITKGSDGLCHFKWGDRSGSIVDDLIIFPDEATFIKVKTGRPADRVYILKFNSGDRKFMFWLQDKLAADKDDELCAKVNQILNNPATDVSEASGPGGMAPDAWMQMLGLPPTGSRAGGQPAGTGAVTGSTTNLDLSSLLNPNSGSVPSQQNSNAQMMASILQMSRQQQQANEAVIPLSLTDVVTAEAVNESGILSNPRVVAELSQHLPEGQQLEENLRSPQMRQALGTLTEALQSDSYNSVLANFSIRPEAGSTQLAQGDSVGAFLTSLQAAHPATIQGENMNSSAESVPTNAEANDEKGPDNMEE